VYLPYSVIDESYKVFIRESICTRDDLSESEKVLLLNAPLVLSFLDEA
jgi:hypothetical protein